MRPIVFANLFLSFYIIQLQVRPAVARSRFVTEYPVYHNMTFDMLQRGTMNITGCARDLLNCWEIVRPELICYTDRYFESICGVMRQECSERLGPLDHDYGQSMTFYENVCQYWQYHTRRFIIKEFGPELGHQLMNGQYKMTNSSVVFHVDSTTYSP